MDIRAIYELTACVLLGIIGYLLLIQFSTPGLKGLRWFIAGYTCAAAGMELIALRDHLPAPPFVLASNLLLVFANVCVYWGVADLLAARRRVRSILVLSMVPVLTLVSYYIFLHNQLTPRIITFSFINAAQFALLLALVMRNGSARTRMPRFGLGVIAVLWIAAHLTRAWITYRHKPIFIADEGRDFNHFILLVPVMTAVTTCLAFIWLAMAQLQIELEEQSHTDVLTGLLNRRALAKIAQREISRAIRFNTPLSLVICDLDHFKAINDRFGHDAGDVALSCTATCIEGALRTNDVVARLGGEEFVLLLPNTNDVAALQVAERIRQLIAAMTVQHRQRNFALTASFGVAAINTTDVDWEDIMRRADLALYRAKAEGRDRAIVFDGRIHHTPYLTPIQADFEPQKQAV